MLDLIAITIGLLAFCGWSALMLFSGYTTRLRRERSERMERIARMTEHAKVEPRQPTPSAEARKRAQA